MTAAHGAEMDNFQTVTAVQLQALQENETAMAELREALAQREQRITALVAAETSAANRVLELESMVATSEDRLRDLDGIRRQLADARSEIVETERSAQAQIGELARQVAVLEGQVNRDEIALKTATDRVAQLETDLASAREEVTALTDNDALAALAAARDAAVLEARNSSDRLADARSAISIRDARIFELERTIRRSRSSEDQYTDLASELEASQQAVLRLESELAAAQQAASATDQNDLIASLEQARVTADARADALQAEIASLSTQLIAQRESNASLQQELSDQKGQFEELRKNAVGLESSRDQIAQLEQQLDLAQREASDAQGEALALEAARDRALSELAQLQAELTDQQSTLAARAEARAEAESEIAALRSQLSDAEEAAQQALHAGQVSADALAEMTQRLERSQAELAQLRANRGDSATAVAALATERDEALELADELAGEVAQAQNALASREAETDGLRKQIAELETKLATNQQTRSTHDQSDLVAQLQSELAALEQALAEADQTELVNELAASRDRLRGDIRVMNDQLIEARRELGTRDARIYELQRGAESTGATEAQLADLRDQLQAHQGEIAALQSELTKAEQALADSDQSTLVVSLQEARDIARNEASQLMGEVEDMQAALASNIETITSLSAENDQLRSSLNAADRSEELMALVTARDAALARVAALEAQQAELNTAADARNARIADLESELEFTNSSVADLEAARDSAAQAANQLSSELLVARESLGARDTQIADLNRRIDALDIELGAAQQAVREADQSETLSALAAERDAAVATAARLEETITDLSGTLDDRNSQVATVQSELQQRAAQLADTTAARDAATLEAQALSDQIRELRAEVSVRDTRISDLEKAVQDSGRTAEALAQSQQALERAEQSNSLLQTELATALAVVAETGDMAADMAALEQAQNIAQAEVDRLTAELNEAWTSLDANASAIAELSGQNADLTEQLFDALVEANRRDRSALVSELQRELTAARTALDEADQSATVAALENARANAVAQVDRLRDELGSMDVALGRARANENRLQAELDAARQQVAASDATAQIASLERARDTAVATATQLGEELTAAETALTENMAVIAELTGRNDQLQTELMRTEQALSTTRSQGASGGEIEELTRARNAAAAEAQRLAAELEDLQSSMDSNGLTIAELTGENDRLEGDLAASERALAAALAAQASAMEEAQMNDALNMEVTTLHNRVQ